MQSNLLDKIFRNHLKEQEQLPTHISFRKDKIFRSIETKINGKSTSKWQFAVAALILMICSSGYWNYEQQQIILKQNTALIQQSKQISAITNQSDIYKSKQEALIDSLKLIQYQIQNQKQIVRLAPLTKIVVNQPIVFKGKNESEHITIRYFTQYKSQKKQEIKLPELDLPVVYESETLANNNMNKMDSPKLSRKIRKLLQN